MKIDYVVPYVDSTKEKWQELFKKYSKEFLSDTCEFSKRFSVNPLFKYSLRGVEKFMPWINQVIIIVQDEDQIPDFINKDNVKIIFHKDFIPSEFLPTFNANTIEMFLHRIPGLSDIFIYGNDDTYVTNYCEPSDFFFNALPRNNKRFIKASSDEYSKMMVNLTKSVWKKIYNVDFPKQDGYYTNFHIQQPYSKKINEKIFNLFADEINKHLKPFRNEKQFTQVLFGLYFSQITNGKYLNNVIKYKYINLQLNCEKAYDTIIQHKEQLICLNDGDEKSNSYVMPAFEHVFNQKSKYEK